MAHGSGSGSWNRNQLRGTELMKGKLHEMFFFVMEIDVVLVEFHKNQSKLPGTDM
jgi:hypothetical protein